MSPEAIGYIGLAIMMVLLLMRVWVGIVLALIGFLGVVVLQGIKAAAMVIGQMPYQMINTYEYSVMPMFILMGLVVADTRIGADMYYTARALFGQFRGGLVHATIFACAALAAITGSSSTGILVMSRVALPEMGKFGYDRQLSSASIAASATLGILIPPSIGFILYGIITQLSIGKLFIAGIIPGILQAIFYMIVTYIVCRINPKMGPPGPRTTVKEKVYSLKNTWAILALFLLVMGGIYGGIFTPTEAGAVGAFGACIIGLAMRRLKGGTFLKTVLETTVMTSMILIILAGTSVFMKFMAVSKVPIQLGNLVAGLDVPFIVIIIILVIFYLILGCFLPVIPIVLITVPILYPMILTMGFDPIWFGVILVRMMEIGALSPPYGMNVFILSGMTGIPAGTIFRGVVWFIIADIAHVALIVAVPALSLFLPNLMSV